MSEQPSDVAGSLIAALEGGAEYVDDGGFTLDAAQARTKLREHQLADPHAWVLLAISAGVLATGGRGPVHVRCAGSATTIQFAGVTLAANQLEHCFAAVFGRERGLEGQALREARVLRLLGLAGNAALAFRSTQFSIESTEPSGARACLSVDAAGQSISHEQVSTTGAVGLRVTVSGRSERKAACERELVRERCRYSEAQVFLSNEQISLGPNAAFEGTSRVAEVCVEHRSVGYAGFLPDSDAPAKALIINRGVLAEAFTLGGCMPGFVAIVEVDLPMDLSQRQILRNADWDALITAIRSTHAELPKPLARLTGLPSQFGSRPWRIAKVAAPVLGVGLLAIIVMLQLDTCDHGERERLRASCADGDDHACRQLLRKTRNPAERRTLLEQACANGHASSCIEHAEAVYHGTGGRPAPNAGLAMMIELCEHGDRRACDRANHWADDAHQRARLNRANCRVHPTPKQCAGWLAHELERCDDVDDAGCAGLREVLTASCKLGVDGRCVEAGWMFELGYGGKRYQTIAKQMYADGCERQDDEACNWQHDEVSEASCTHGLAWACYALGVEAYKRHEPNHRKAIDWFERACQAGLPAGCVAAAGLGERGEHPPPVVFPRPITRPK